MTWRDSDVRSAEGGPRTSPAPDFVVSARGAAKIETIEKGDMMADDGGVSPVLTREHFEGIRDRHRRHAKTRYDAEALIREIERLHPEWRGPQRWKVTASQTVEAPDRKQAMLRAFGGQVCDGYTIEPVDD